MVERELKVDVPREFVLPPLTGVAGLHRGPASHRMQVSVYWDTPDCRLIANGVGLRWRSDSGWTSKSAVGATAPPSTVDAALLTREERTVAGAPGAPPAELVQPLAGMLAGLPLAPVVRIQTERTAVELCSSDGSPRVELVDDRVQVLDGPLERATWRELELELREVATGLAGAREGIQDATSTDASMLAALLARLREAGAGRVVAVAKHLRALGSDTEPAPRSLDAYQLAGRIAERLSSSSTRAAGGVVLRGETTASREVLVVHRPRYDDWCLPKGKQDSSESLAATALREVEEETGLRCEMVAPLGCGAHPLRGGGTKVVWWWAMRAVAGVVTPSEETDQVAWLRREEALRTLSHAGERELLERAVDSR